MHQMPTETHYEPVRNLIQDTFSKVASEPSIDEGVVATAKELAAKSEDVFQAIREEDSRKLETALVEAEQAADSALTAAEASSTAGEETVKRIKSAHDHMKQFKEEYIH